MRFMLALLTIGAAGAGYAYVNHPQQTESFVRESLGMKSAPVEEPGLRPLFDWASDHGVLPDPARARDAVAETQAQVRSALDDFIAEHNIGEGSLDDVYSRVKERVQTTLANKPTSTPADEPIPTEQPASSVERDLVSSIANALTATPATSGVNARDWQEGDQQETVASTTNSGKSVTEPETASVPEPTSTQPDSSATTEPTESVTRQEDSGSVSEPAQAAATPKKPETPVITPSDITSSQESQPTKTSVRPATVVRGTDTGTSSAGQSTQSIVSSVGANSNEMIQSRPKGPVRREPLIGEWQTITKTREGRPLHTRRYGNTGNRTLIIAGLSGEDRFAVRWLDLLSDELAKQPELFASHEVLIFRAANPDGLVRSVAENGRGVLINRNFPSRRQRTPFDFRSSDPQAMEIETRAVLDALYSFKPQRVIHLAATTAKTHVNYNSPARDVAQTLNRDFQIEVQPLNTASRPGSIEEFVDGTLKVSMLTMRLELAKEWETTWPQYQQAVLSALVDAPLDGPKLGRRKSGEVAQTETDHLDANAPVPVPVPQEISPTTIKRTRRGFEALPPPPRN